MSYIINKTDGTILTEIVDGTINQTSTDLTLIGKNSTSYGELFNENFVKILENFANSSQPNNPIKGQLWYDTAEGRLKVYNGFTWKVSGGTIVSNTVPSSIVQGDIWIDSYRKQLYFNDGTATILAGPDYTAQQGISGLQIIDIEDTSNVLHTVALLYVGQALLGIFSKDTFTPNTPISGYSGAVNVGFNVSTWSGVKFNVPVGRAESLLAADGSVLTAESFMSALTDTSTTGSISIANSTPLYLGTGQNNEISVNSSLFQITSNSSNQNFKINVKNSNGILPGLFINAQSQFVGLYTESPTATLDVNGDVVVQGTLTVNGSTTIISTTTVEIEDKLIELGKVASASNATANGGGILLEGGGDGDKTITWSSSIGVGGSWTTSEHFNIPSGKAYHVNGFPVLTQTAIGSTVTSAPGITSVGTLVSLQAGKLSFSNSSITFTDIAANGNITLVPKGSGVVDVSSKRIVNVSTPTSNNDAVNLLKLNTTVRIKSLALTINVGALTNLQICSQILDKVYPSSELENTTICRVWCLDTGETRQYTTNGTNWSGGTVI